MKKLNKFTATNGVDYLAHQGQICSENDAECKIDLQDGDVLRNGAEVLILVRNGVTYEQVDYLDDFNTVTFRELSMIDPRDVTCKLTAIN